MFLRYDSHALVVLTEVASDDIEHYFAGGRYQRDILCFVKYHYGGIVPLLQHPPIPPLNTNDDIEQSPPQGGPRLTAILISSTETPPGRTAFPFANNGWHLSTPTSQAELLTACSWPTDQRRWQYSGRASAIWRTGEWGTTGAIVHGRGQGPEGIWRSRL